MIGVFTFALLTIECLAQNTYDDGVFTTSGIEKRNATEEFIKAGFVPAITAKPPQTTLEVHYYLTEVVFGNQLSSFIVRLAPGTLIWPVEKDQYYTLIMVGPDCPTRDEPTESEFQHWIIGNIPGSNIQAGENITEYAGVIKNYKLGYPRFIFLMFKQPSKEKIKFDEERLPRRPITSKRVNFSTKDFTKKYSLGDPVAGNYLTVCLDIPFPDL